MVFPIFMIYIGLTLIATIVALNQCNKVEQVLPVVLLWPIALPVLVYNNIKDVHKENEHIRRLEDKRREMEAFEQMMKDDKKVDKYLE